MAADAETGQALARQDAPDLIICDGTLDLPELPASSRILRVVPRGRPASGQAVALPFRPSELNLHV